MKLLPPTADSVAAAANALREGLLVGLPTETVYGIAAVATNREAVLRTFALKGRPAENPLIVHVADLEHAEHVTSSIPPVAQVLAQAFWPGPLTLVLPKRDTIPSEATAGLDTVAVRVPSHPVAQSLLRSVALPLTAPSANSFMGLSPTRADHISAGILFGLECVLDGGPCSTGIESTVVDCSTDSVTILRPGVVSRAMIEAVVGPVRVTSDAGSHRSPGHYPRHYAPSTPVRIAKRLEPADAGIVLGDPRSTAQVRLSAEPGAYAAHIYSTLYALDQLDLPEIVIEAPPGTPEWEAVWDRIRKAAAKA